MSFAILGIIFRREGFEENIILRRALGSSLGLIRGFDLRCKIPLGHRDDILVAPPILLNACRLGWRLAVNALVPANEVVEPEMEAHGQLVHAEAFRVGQRTAREPREFLPDAQKHPINVGRGASRHADSQKRHCRKKARD